MAEVTKNVREFLPRKDAYKDSKTSKRGGIEKNGRFFHMVQRCCNREDLYDMQSARYRHDLLCRLCVKHGVGIMFSVVMPNHTHDLLYAESVERISEVMRELNTQVSRFIRKNSPHRFKKRDVRVFDERPIYIAIKNIRHLGVVGKYIYENAAPYERLNKFVPFSCFFGMRNGYVPTPPYQKDLYEFVYGMDVQCLVDFFEKSSTKEVERLMEQRFSSWKKEDSDAFFKVDPSSPWFDDEIGAP